MQTLVFDHRRLIEHKTQTAVIRIIKPVVNDLTFCPGEEGYFLLPEGGTFFRLKVYKWVQISRVEV